MKKNFISKFFSFFPGVVDIADKCSFANISTNFRKNLKWSYWDTQGPGGHWFMKKIWCRKSRVRLPLKTMWTVFLFFGYLLQRESHSSSWTLRPFLSKYSFFNSADTKKSWMWLHCEPTRKSPVQDARIVLFLLLYTAYATMTQTAFPAMYT